MAARDQGPACHACGCTQNNACGMGCSWVRLGEKPLCSNPICLLIDALENEAAWLWDETRTRRRRSIADKKKSLRAIRKLVREVKSQRGELG